MFIRIHPDNPQPRLIQQTVDYLREGGVIVYPTDTIYGLGCDIFHAEAVQRIARLKQLDMKKHHFSIICHDLSQLSDFAKQISTPLYRMLKEYLPGPYTFILPASKMVPKLLQSKKSTIGLRIPDNKIALAILKEIGHPIISASLPGEMVEEYTDPELIRYRFEKEVDLVTDGCAGGMFPSTVLDCTGDEVVLVREGKGEWE